MGLVKTEELSNGNIGLEIIYGGKEAPFGGVDTSAPPAYIDPRCFASSDGFLVVDNKLVAVSLQPTLIPTLWGGIAGVQLLKFGTFYNSINGQLNYALGYTSIPFNGPPSGVNYVFYMTAWNPTTPGTPLNDTLSLTIFDAVSILEQASITLDLIASGQSSNTTGTGATGTVTVSGGSGNLASFAPTGGASGTGYAVGSVGEVTQGSNISGWILITAVNGSGAITAATIANTGDNYVAGDVSIGSVETASSCALQIVGPGGTFPYSVPSYNVGAYTRQQVVDAMVGEINGNATPPYLPPGVAANPDVTAAASLDGFSIILTANVPGIGGNAITVQDISANQTPTLAPPFYFSCRAARNLQGGQITESANAPRYFTPPASTAEVGGTLYIANLGPLILKYSGPGGFTTSTMYQGVGVIKKFAGSLIGLRIENQLGVYTQNQDMIFAWSAALDLDEWSPVNNVGNVTGAGFEQIADIGDYLTGLVVSNGTAYIIRSQGVSYATATGNATLPYAINHIGLGDRGEGAQVSNLVCQYDQIGVFVGNTNIFQISGSISSIGDKIKSLFFQSFLNNAYDLPANGTIYSVNAIAIEIGGDVITLVVFSVGFISDPNTLAVFIFNVSNGTWSIISFIAAITVGNYKTSIQTLMLSALTELNGFALANEFNQSLQVLGEQSTTEQIFPPAVPVLNTPILYTLVEGIPNASSISKPCSVTFPEEEISFGRDITIDALYVALWASVSENTFIDFYISGILYATLELTAAVFNTLSGNPIEQQLYSTNTGAGAFTIHAPQLSYTIRSFTDAGTAQVRFSKFTIFGSFDPAQRPV